MASAANNMLRLITPPNFPTPIDKSDSTVATGNARKLQSLPTPTLGLPPPNNTTTTLVQSSDLASKALSKLTSEPAGTVAHEIVMLNQASAEKKLQESGSKAEIAKNDAHVDAAERNFFKKIGSVAANIVVVIIASVATAASVGGAAPVLALACVSLAISIGDAACAYQDWQLKSAAQNEGKTSEQIEQSGLPCGGSCIANATHHLAEKAGASTEQAKVIANGVDLTIRVGLGVAMAYTGAGIGGATDWVSYVAASAGLLTQIDGIVYGAKDLHKGWQEAKEKKSTSEISQSETPMIEELTNFSDQIKTEIAPGLQEQFEELKTQLKKLEAENVALKLQQQQSSFPAFA